ncbi:MAG TPA: hypothetical protein VF407_02255 [Polyangiaceae bacterium]
MNAKLGDVLGAFEELDARDTRASQLGSEALREVRSNRGRPRDVGERIR